MTSFDTFLKIITQFLNISDTSPDKDGKYIFILNDDLEIELSPSMGAGFITSGILINLSEKKLSETQLKSLLYWSTIHMQTRDSILTVDNKTNQIILYTLFSSSLSDKNILEKFQDFIKDMELWKIAIKENLESNDSSIYTQSTFIKP